MKVKGLYINSSNNSDLSDFEYFSLRKLQRNPRDLSVPRFVIEILLKNNLIKKSNEFYYSNNRKIFYYDITGVGISKLNNF